MNENKTQEQGEIAFYLHNKVKENEIKRRQLLFESMEAIHEIHKSKQYKIILGDEDAPWSAYLGQHDTYYSASQIYAFDKIYSKFMFELGIKPEQIAQIPNTKLLNLVSVVNKENVLEWLNKAETLTTQDFEDELRVLKGGVSYLDCTHKYVPYSICTSCGNRHKGQHEETN